MVEGYWRYGAFGSVLEDESGEKETAAEEVDGERVEDAMNECISRDIDS